MKVISLVFVLLLLAPLSFSAETRSECYAECQAEYDSAVAAAQAMAAAGKYTESVTYGGTCPRTSSYGGSGPYANLAKCVAVQQICIDGGNSDCSSVLQSCCLEEAILAWSNTKENCESNCDYNFPEEEDEGPYPGGYDDYLGDDACPTSCINGKIYKMVYVGDGICEVHDFSPIETCSNGCIPDNPHAGCRAEAEDLCSDFYERFDKESCYGNTHYYDCYCDPSNGEPRCELEDCSDGCDSAGLRCKEDACSGTSCQDRCESPGNDFERIQRNGACNPTTGECTYTEEIICTAGCSMVGGKPSCNEDCDNGLDDDLDGLVDCADTACSSSLYCTCEKIASSAGPIGGKSMVILIGGYSFPDTTFFYNYKNRDEEVKSDANRIANALRTTSPFNEMNFEIYATRLPEGVFTGPWRSDLLSKCSSAGGDFTLFLNYKDSTSLSRSKLYSMSATVYWGAGNPSKEGLELTVLHEMGHGFGGLWDEYTIAEEIGLGTGTLAVVRDSAFSKRANCAIAPDTKSCDAYFSKFGVSYDCVKGCSAGAWYRPSEESIMNNVYSSSQFNEVSKKILRDRINAFAHPPLPRTFQSWDKWVPGKSPEPLR